MTDKNTSDQENSPTFGSGCLVSFIFFFGFSFFLGVKDGNIAGSIVAFAITAFLVFMFLHPKPRKPKPHGNGAYSFDSYDEGFYDGMSAGFFMAESMRQNDGAHDDEATFAGDADEEWEDWD